MISISTKALFKKIYPLILVLFSYLIFFESKAQAPESYQWKSLPIGGGGFVSAIIPSKTENKLFYARTDVGGAYRWDNAISKWIPLTDWVSEGETGYLGVESLALDPKASNKLYLYVGISYFNNGKTAILRSNDYGKTFKITEVTSQFKAHGNGIGRANGERLVVDPNSTNILFCGTRANGLFKSLDSGATWTKVNSLDITTTPNENGIGFVVFDPSSGTDGVATKTIFAGVSRNGSNLYRSDDGGATFNAITGGPSTNNLMPQKAVLASDKNLYITFGNGAGPHGHWDTSLNEPMENGQVWKYNITNGTWVNVTPNITKAYGGISVDPMNPNRVVASTINSYMEQGDAWGDRIFLSTNGGSSWTDVIARGFKMDPNGNPWIAGHSIHWAGSLEFDPFDTKKVWVTSGNGIFKTEDIDATTNIWKFMVDGLEETVPLDMISIANGPSLSVIGDYDGFRHTDVTQYAPIHTPRMGTSTSISYANLKPSVILRAGDKLFYSTDMGLTWKECSSKGKKGRVAISADGKVFLHCPDGSTTTYRSIDNGTTWAAVSGLNVSSIRPVADPVNPDKFYSYDPNGDFYVSVNAGVSFAKKGTPGANGSKIIRVVPNTEGDVWVALFGGGLTRSKNSGESFTKIEGVASCGAIGFGKEAPGKSFPTIYIWGSVNNIVGIHRSTDEGVTWTRINDDDHEYGGPGNGQFVIGDMNVFGRVFMSTAGRGIVYGESNQTCPPTLISPSYQVNSIQSSGSIIIANEGNTVLLSSDSDNSGTWDWTGPNGFTANTKEVTFNNIKKENAGLYTVRYTLNGCKSADLVYKVSVNETVTATAIELKDVGYTIYPNPSATGTFILEMNEVEQAEISIYDTNKRLIYNAISNGVNRKVEINQNLERGFYFISIRKGNHVIVKKLIVKGS